MRSAVVLLFVALVGWAVSSPRPARADTAATGSGSGSGSDGSSSAGFRTDKGAFGLGLVLGEPTGVCGKLYIRNDQAIAVAAGATFISAGLQLSGDYLFHPAILQDRDSFVMPLYLGPGIRFIDYTGTGGYFAVGIRGVIGLAFDFKTAPVDVFVEAAIVLETGFDKAHEGDAAINAGAGVRYYF
jgi:hypothetical protein